MQIDEKKEMGNLNDERLSPIVSIHCLVYNHEQYLRQCLDGFVMQQTNFAFEAIVHDDFSSDGSVAIIMEYANKFPDIIKPIIESENQYSRGGFALLNSILWKVSHGKYIALCEGDDYWTDPLKLQKQVDYLNSHPECGLVYTKAAICEDGVLVDKVIGYEKNVSDGLTTDNPIPTVTTMFRSYLYLQFYEEFKQEKRSWKMGDKPFWFYCQVYSQIKFLPEITAVYRILKESASRSGILQKMLAFRESSRDINLLFINKYISDVKQKEKEIYITYNHYYVSIMYLYLLHGKKRDAIKTLYEGAKYLPLSDIIKYLIYIYVPFVWDIRKYVG